MERNFGRKFETAYMYIYLLLQSLMYIENTYLFIWPHVSYALKLTYKIASKYVPHFLFYMLYNCIYDQGFVSMNKRYVNLMIPSDVMENFRLQRYIDGIHLSPNNPYTQKSPYFSNSPIQNIVDTLFLIIIYPNGLFQMLGISPYENEKICGEHFIFHNFFS